MAIRAVRRRSRRVGRCKSYLRCDARCRSCGIRTGVPSPPEGRPPHVSDMQSQTRREVKEEKAAARSKVGLTETQTGSQTPIDARYSGHWQHRHASSMKCEYEHKMFWGLARKFGI